jgi:polyisoprenoid-binding protein YceI
MNKHIATFVLLAVMAAVGVVGYTTLKTPAAASGPTQAIPLQPDNSASNQTSSVQTDATSGKTVFSIDPGEATARFKIDEVLRGEAKTVVGTTDQVAAQMALDLSQPSAAQFGPILINARTLATDDSQRNRMIQNFILSTNQYEYITFTPTAVSGLPQAAQVGNSYQFQIAGQLTIKDVTRDVTFDASVTPRSATELEGTANTSIRFADWGISIPSVPFVAGVSDQVHLELDFVAGVA